MAKYKCPLKQLKDPCIEDECPLWRSGAEDCGLSTITTMVVTITEPLERALSEYLYTSKKGRGGM